MDAQEFLKDKIAQIALMLAVPSPARTVINIKGSTPQGEVHTPGPLIKIGLDGIQTRDDNQIYYDKEMGYYGPGKLN